MFLKLIHNKKAQAAMEFLMTYGWAILIVIVAIAALFFLGVFSGSAPSVCQIEPPFNCIDSFATTGTLQLQIGGLNSVKNVPVGNIVISVDGVEICAAKTLQSGSPEIVSGGKDTVVCNDNTFSEDEKYNGEVVITYDNKIGISGKTARGTFSGTAKAL